jgi:hypothetical protein
MDREKSPASDPLSHGIPVLITFVQSETLVLCSTWTYSSGSAPSTRDLQITSARALDRHIFSRGQPPLDLQTTRYSSGVCIMTPFGTCKSPDDVEGGPIPPPTVLGPSNETLRRIGEEVLSLPLHPDRPASSAAT